jgi:hypothetical protein
MKNEIYSLWSLRSTYKKKRMDIVIVLSSIGDGYRHRGLPSDPRNTGGSL